MSSPIGQSPIGKRQKQLEQQDVSMVHSTPDMNGSSSKSANKAAIEENGGGFEKVMTKEEKRKDKKRKREEKIKVFQRPQFMFNTDGFKHHKRIGVAHIRDLVLHIVTEHTAPNWILVQHRSNVAHTVVVLAPGIEMTDLGLEAQVLTPSSYLPFSIASTSTASPSRIPVMSKIFSVACPTRAPGDSRRLFSVVQTLLQTPLSQAEQKKKEKQKERMVAARNEDLGDPTIYLLTPSQMVDNDYPMPEYMPLRGDEPYLPGRKMKQTDQDRELDALARTSNIPRKGQGAGWRETPKADTASDKHKVLAIDCEMCLTEDGQELTRATVIDYESGKVLFDELCMPKKPVLDYLTRWSGITAAKLQHATLSLEDIQARLLDGPDALLTPHTILLGHSLESDLCALKIRHPLCIDTALLYKHARGPPYKPALKWLCSQWLGRQIQTAGEGGHDSEEDARACLDLLRMKVAQGPNFGEVGSETESIFERMARHAQSSNKPGRSAAICDYGNPSQWHGQRARTAVRCINDDDVAKGLIEHAPTHDFSFGRFMGISAARGWSANTATDSKPLEVVEPEVADSAAAAQEADVDAALAQFDQHLSSLHAALPSGTALILLTGHSDPRPMLKLGARKAEFERLYRALGADGLSQLKPEQRWSTEDDRNLEEAAMRARTGAAFFCVKS